MESQQGLLGDEAMSSTHQGLTQERCVTLPCTPCPCPVLVSFSSIGPGEGEGQRQQ